jgi:hypothetical protein
LVLPPLESWLGVIPHPGAELAPFLNCAKSSTVAMTAWP